MDSAVALVQAYLHINGYFTVTEYPIVEAMRREGGYRTSTELDVLAVRFPTAGRLVPRRGGRRQPEEEIYAPDPELGTVSGRVDMLIGEVKQGRAELNRGARNPVVLRAVLARFGCCPAGHVASAVQNLIDAGRTDMATTHHARLIAFGSSTAEPLGYPCEVMSLGHILGFTQSYLQENWDVLRHAPFSDPALGMLVTMQKAMAHGDDNGPPRDDHE
jgi:hypothetical protein